VPTHLNTFSDNVRSFLAWAMSSSKYCELSDHDKKEIEELLNLVYERLDFKRISGFNPSVSHVSMCLQDIPHTHRPLLMYVFTGVLEVILSNTALYLMGFCRLSINSTCDYWYYGHGKNDGQELRTPLILFHGITIGWSFYIILIYYLIANRDIILVDVNGIKINSLCFDLPTPKEFADNIMKIIQRHNFGKVSIVGHSFGTILAGMIIIHLTCISSYMIRFQVGFWTTMLMKWLM
jgi:hypothetical protein